MCFKYMNGYGSHAEEIYEFGGGGGGGGSNSSSTTVPNLTSSNLSDLSKDYPYCSPVLHFLQLHIIYLYIYIYKRSPLEMWQYCPSGGQVQKRILLYFRHL